MTDESLQTLLVLAIGFAFAAVLTTGYQLLTLRPPTFRLVGQGPSLGALAAVPFLVFAAPFIIMRNTIRDRRLEQRRFEVVMLATILAGFWSLMSGTALVMALRGIGLPA